MKIKNFSSACLFIMWIIAIVSFLRVDNGIAAAYIGISFGIISALFINLDYPRADIYKIKGKSFLYGTRMSYSLTAILFWYIVIPAYLIAKIKSN